MKWMTFKVIITLLTAGCHGLGGTLDNRERTLTLGSASLNRSHILFKRADPTIPTDVRFYAARKRPYLASITFFGRPYYLFDYVTKEEASRCYQSVQSKRDDILSLWQVDDNISQQTKLLRGFVSNPAPAKVFSSEFTGVTWSKAMKKWQSAIEFVIKSPGKRLELV
jgi:hypothetical protein